MSGHSYGFLVGGNNLQADYFTQNANIGNSRLITSALLRAPSESGADFIALFGSDGSQSMRLGHGCISFVGATGTVGAVVGGVPLTFAASGDNNTDAENLVFAVFGSANPLINPGGAGSNDLGMIGTNVFAVISCGAVVPGDKLYLCGMEFPVIPAGQTPKLPGQWAADPDGDVRAANLVSAINSAMTAGYVAIHDPAIGGSVFVFQTTPFQLLPASVCYSNTSVRLPVTPFAQSNRVMVFPLTPGVPANAVTFAASGTGVTAFGVANGRMSGGQGLQGFPLIQR